jgi:alpha-aminoadipic semialdehyde synthase
MTRIGIRREDKHAFEARAPLTPDGVRSLVEAGVEVVVQPSPIRAFPDDDYRRAGAIIDEELDHCDLVLAVKEIPIALLREGGAYVFFSHTIKGQEHNMPMLKRMMDLGCTLIDYERITDDAGRRLVFFGRHAGLAGMIDTFSVLGARLAHLGHATSLSRIGLAHTYADLDTARSAVIAAGETLGEVPDQLAPMVFGFAGYGNVSVGAQQIFDLMPHEQIEPSALAAVTGASAPPRDRLLKVVFREEDLVTPAEAGADFALQEYYDHPERYRSVFADHARHLSVLINAIFWTEAYPRLLTREQLRTGAAPRLLAIGDISCDIEGAIECTVKATTPGEPTYVYDPRTGSVRDGLEGPGILMMTTDCLPCELPRESTSAFTEALLPHVVASAQADLSGDFTAAELPAPMKRAVILWRGDLTPDYRYLEELLPDS